MAWLGGAIVAGTFGLIFALIAGGIGSVRGDRYRAVANDDQEQPDIWQ
jgi:hypothetical protein